jgi:hypothetical protein
VASVIILSMANPDYPPSRLRGLKRGGSPGRRPGLAGLAREIRRRHGEDARGLVDRLDAALDDPETPMDTKLAIIVFLRDTGWGKPTTRRLLDDAIEREISRRFGSQGERLVDILAEGIGCGESTARRIAEAIIHGPAPLPVDC